MGTYLGMNGSVMSYWLLVPIWWRFESARTLRFKNNSSSIRKTFKNASGSFEMKISTLKTIKIFLKIFFWDRKYFFWMSDFIRMKKSLEFFPVSPFEFNICFWFALVWFISNIIFKMMFVSVVRRMFGVRSSSVRWNVLVRDLSLRILNWVTRLERT